MCIRDRSPAYQEQVNVQVTGEVLYEGDYARTEKSERLSDLIKKAGGVTPFAYIKGARLRDVYKRQSYQIMIGLLVVLLVYQCL